MAPLFRQLRLLRLHRRLLLQYPHLHLHLHLHLLLLLQRQR